MFTASLIGKKQAQKARQEIIQCFTEGARAKLHYTKIETRTIELGSFKKRPVQQREKGVMSEITIATRQVWRLRHKNMIFVACQVSFSLTIFSEMFIPKCHKDGSIKPELTTPCSVRWGRRGGKPVGLHGGPGSP